MALSPRYPDPLWARLARSATTMMLVVWPMFAFASLFAFDASGSENSPFTVMLVLAILAYLPVWLISYIARRVLIAQGRWKAAAWVSLVPLVVIVAGAIAVLGIALVCGGELACSVF